MRARYKQTEVGVIPEDWRESKIGEHLASPIRNGYSPVCPDTTTGLWILSLAAVTHQGFNPAGVKPAPLRNPRVHDFVLTPDDLVVSRSNTPERVVCEKSAEQKPSRFQGLAVRRDRRFRPQFRKLFGLRWSL